MLENAPYKLGFLQRLVGSQPSWILAQKQLHDQLIAFFDPEIQHRQGTPSMLGFLNHLDLPRQVRGREPLHAALYLWGKSMLPNYVLTILGDRMEMAHSIEGRLPFLDHHLVEKVVALPASFKIRGMSEKYILREAVKPYVTDTLYRREKHPFIAPPATLAPEQRLFQMMQDTLRGSALAALPFFDQARVVDYLDRFPRLSPDEQRTADQMLMEILSLCVLQEQFHLASV